MATNLDRFERKLVMEDKTTSHNCYVLPPPSEAVFYSAYLLMGTAGGESCCCALVLFVVFPLKYLGGHCENKTTQAGRLFLCSYGYTQLLITKIPPRLTCELPWLWAEVRMTSQMDHLVEPSRTILIFLCFLLFPFSFSSAMEPSCPWILLCPPPPSPVFIMFSILCSSSSAFIIKNHFGTFGVSKQLFICYIFLKPGFEMAPLYLIQDHL